MMHQENLLVGVSALLVPAVKATRFFQIENQINLALDLQVAASLPLIK